MLGWLLSLLFDVGGGSTIDPNGDRGAGLDPNGG